MRCPSWRRSGGRGPWRSQSAKRGFRSPTKCGMMMAAAAKVPVIVELPGWPVWRQECFTRCSTSPWLPSSFQKAAKTGCRCPKPGVPFQKARGFVLFKLSRSLMSCTAGSAFTGGHRFFCSLYFVLVICAMAQACWSLGCCRDHGARCVAFSGECHWGEWVASVSQASLAASSQTIFFR